MAPGTPIDWQDAPSTLTPVNAANLKHHDAWMVEQVVAAQGSADAAAASAVEAAAPGDDAVAAMVADTGSATSLQLDARFATDADVAASIAALQAQSASIEDLFISVPLQTTGGTWTNAADLSAPIFSAPFPLTVTSVTLTFWGSGVTIALSDTSYWRAVVRKTNAANTATTDIAYKTTRVTASAPYPAGQVWTSRKAWTFDAAAFVSADMEAGGTLHLATLPVGTPTAISMAFIVTVGYRPL